MKKGILKKSAALVMAAVMMFSMGGCGKKDGSKKEEKTDTKEMVFEGTEMALEGIEGDVGSFVVKDDRIYFYTSEWIEGKGSEEESDKEDTEDNSEEVSEEDNSEETTSEENTEENSSNDSEEASTEEGSEETTEDITGEENGDTAEDTSSEDDEDTGDEEIEGTNITRMYSANLDGSDVKEIPLPELSDNEYLFSMLPEEDGNITLMLNSWDEKTEKTTYSVMKIDSEGKELLKEDITNVLKVTQETYISKIMLDDKGRLIVVTDQSVFVLDENYGKILCELKSDSNYIEGAAKTKDGRIICGASGEDGAKVQVLDIENKKWGESIKIDLQYFQSSDSLMDGIEYDFYYKNDSGIYGYDIEGKKSTKIIDYVASNISSDNSYNIIPIAKDQLLGTEWEDSGDSVKTKFVLYKKVDPSTIADKTTITFGAMWIDDSVKKAAIEFNKQSKEYQIEFKDYSNEEDPETKFNADIVAGNVPDIISLSNLPIEQYAAKGLLEDLTPYFDKDSDIKAGDIIPSVAEAMKIDNKFYYIAPSFGISTLIASSKDVGTESGWTFEDLKALLEEKGDGVRPFYSENKSEMLYSFLSCGINDYIDWNTGECSFDSQDFKDILEICNKGTDEETEYSEDSPSEPSLIREGKVLFSAGWLDMESVQLYEKMFEGDITFIGYPNKDKEGSYFNFDNPLGIYSKSDVKDGAWEFIKSLMTKEYQGKSGNLYNNPTRQDCFDMLIKAKTTTKAYTDELGQEITPLESSWGWDDLEVEIKPLNEKEENLYKDLVNNTKKAGGYNSALMDIITEEAKPYFAGEKSLDETVDIIQNRVKTYVNENR